MNGDDVLAALHARQGYLVLNTTRPYEIGEVVRLVGAGNDIAKTPLVVVGIATREEYDKQERLSDELTKRPGPFIGNIDPYFYRVEAAD